MTIILPSDVYESMLNEDPNDTGLYRVYRTADGLEIIQRVGDKPTPTPQGPRPRTEDDGFYDTIAEWKARGWWKPVPPRSRNG